MSYTLSHEDGTYVIEGTGGSREILRGKINAIKALQRHGYSLPEAGVVIRASEMGDVTLNESTSSKVAYAPAEGSILRELRNIFPPMTREVYYLVAGVSTVKPPIVITYKKFDTSDQAFAYGRDMFKGSSHVVGMVAIEVTKSSGYHLDFVREDV